MTAPAKYVGKPDGPPKHIPELGCAVNTFTTEPGGRFPALMHHVPLDKRGWFRPTDLANYDMAKEYRTDALGYVMCYATTASGKRCKRKAVNRCPRCNFHGGRVHPLDKVVVEEPEDEEVDAEPEPMSRYQQFLAGQITVADLDDEELTSLGFRNRAGRIFKPKNVPREMVTVFTRAIYDRSLQELKTNTLEAAKTLASIMIDPANDIGIRFKAAEAILDRSLGKAPQVVAVTGAAAWEEIFDEIATNTRAESRARRGIQEALPSNDNTIEAQVVDLE